jgi:hypothetical protein
MTGSGMEKFFKTVFTLAIIVAIIFAIGIFLLILKIILLFVPELHIMGLTIIQ